MAKRHMVMGAFYRDEVHHLLDRLASALAAKGATAAQAKSWAHRARSLRGQNKKLREELHLLKVLEAQDK